MSQLGSMQPLTDDEHVRGLHPLLRLVSHHIKLTGVQAFVNVLVPRLYPSAHLGFLHAARRILYGHCL